VQGGLRDAGLGRDRAEALAVGFEEPRVLDLVGGVGHGAADVAALGLGDRAGVRVRLGRCTSSATSNSSTAYRTGDRLPFISSA